MEKLKYIKSIDGLRAIAVIGVLASHFGVFRSGWLGVQLFFVISGFLIISILLREKESGKSIGFLIKRFYYRRFLRIFPLYYFYILILVTLYSFYFKNIHDLLPKISGLTTYTYNISRFSHNFHYTYLVNHLWSLCVEEQFYLIFPVFVFIINVKNLKRLFLFILIFSPLFRAVICWYCKIDGFNEMDTGDIVYVLTPSHFDAFVSGGAITLFALDERLRANLIFIMFGILFIISGVINAYLLGENFFDQLGYNIIGIRNYQHIWSYSLANLFFASTILLLVSQQPSRIRFIIDFILSSKIFSIVGRVSYGMYIYHWVILYFFMNTIKLPILNFVLYCFIVFLFSYASYTLFESKLINLKDRYFKLN